MSAVYTRRWKSVVRAEYTLTDGPTVWVHRVDPPPRTPSGDRRPGQAEQPPDSWFPVISLVSWTSEPLIANSSPVSVTVN